MSTGPTYTETDVDPYDFDYLQVDRGTIVDNTSTTTLDVWSALMLALIGLIVTAPWWVIA